MIHDTLDIAAMHFDLFQRVHKAHVTFRAVVARLRDATQSVLASDATFWANVHESELTRLTSLRSLVRSAAERNYPEMTTPTQGYLDTIPELVAACRTAAQGHAQPTEPLTSQERRALADFIAARLGPVQG